MSDIAFDVMATGFRFCEAPRVDGDGTIWFSDLLGGGYHRRRPDGAIELALPGRLWIGGATRDLGDAVLCGGQGGLVLARDGIVTPVLSAIAGRPIVAVNDIEADASGAVYGGTIDFAAIFERGETPTDGILFRLDPAGVLTVLRDDVVGSNGIGFSPDGRTMYHSESTVGVWAWSMRDGIAAAPPRLLIPADDCDGLAVDQAGGLWVAFWRAAMLRRYHRDGSLDRTIALPFPNIVSLAFGGADGRDLYVTTGGEAGQGGVIRLRSDVPGCPVHRSAFARRLDHGAFEPD